MTERTGALDSINFGSRTTGEQAGARSRLVRRLRIALPIIGIVLVAAFFVNTRSNQTDATFLEDFTDLEAATEELRIANPRFDGFDKAGDRYEITAASAMQNDDDRNIVALEKPKAVQGGENKKMTASAETGIYRSKENILELSDGVTFEHQLEAKTYLFRTSEATVSIENKVVTSDAGVEGEGPDGSALKADRVTAYQDQGRLVFEGNVSMRIYPQPASANNNAPGQINATSDEPDSADPTTGEKE